MQAQVTRSDRKVAKAIPGRSARAVPGAGRFPLLPVFPAHQASSLLRVTLTGPVSQLMHTGDFLKRVPKSKRWEHTPGVKHRGPQMARAEHATDGVFASLRRAFAP